MKPASAKKKGTRLEKQIAKSLRDSGLDKQAKRMPMSGSIPGFKSDIFTKLPLIIEAKNQEKWKPVEYMKQAERDADLQNKMPVVIMSRNNFPNPYVMMKMSDWILIMQRAFIENKVPVTSGKMSYSKHKQTNS